MDESASGSSGAPSESWQSELLDHPADMVIAVTVPCRGCGYNLKGLQADGNCPECGVTLLSTLHALVDPDATRMPRLGDPRGVGNGIVLIVGAALLATVLLMLQPIMGWLDRAILLPGNLQIPRDLTLVASIAAVVAILGVWLLKPRGHEPSSAVWRDIFFLGGGAILWALSALLLWFQDRMVGATAGVDPARTCMLLSICAASILGLLGLTGVLNTIGRRSRAYRQAHAAKQPLNPLIAAVAGIAVGATVRVAVAQLEAPATLGTLGMIMVAVCSLMLAVGLTYMLVNVWWIRAALRMPPPGLEQLVLPALPPDTHIPHEDPEGDGDGATAAATG